MRSWLMATVLIAALGLSASAECELTISFCVSPQRPEVGELVRFEVGADFRPHSFIVNYTWDLGNKQVEGPLKYQASTIYRTPGRYTIRLFIMNRLGQVERQERTILVMPGSGETGSLFNLDDNGNHRLDDAEFLFAIDLWIKRQLETDLFMIAIDCWISQRAISMCRVN